MFGILVSAASAIIRWALTAGLGKAVVFGVMAWALTSLLPAVLDALLPGGRAGDYGLGTRFASVADSVYWFLELFQVPTGLSLVLAAYGTRFLIRRMPLIG